MIKLAHKEKIEDQYTDRSGAVLVKIASRMADKKLASLAIDTLYNMERPLQKEATFKTSTAKDTLLSRIYFEGQREKIATDQAEAIAKNLDLYETLHGLEHVKVAFLKQPQGQVKVAAEANAIELLPDCKIASEEELIQAGKDFSREHGELSMPDRRAFAENFFKVASLMDVEIPDSVKLYAEKFVEGRPDIAESVLLRKVAMERQGRGTGGYDVLYENLRQMDTQKLPVEDLHKIAMALDQADTKYNLYENKFSATIPDAWHTVFQVKMAEEHDRKADAAGMNRADIIGQFGEGVLEDVEDEDGNIDRDRLAEIIAAFKKTKSSSEDGDDADAN